MYIEVYFWMNILLSPTLTDLPRLSERTITTFQTLSGLFYLISPGRRHTFPRHMGKHKSKNDLQFKCVITWCFIHWQCISFWENEIVIIWFFTRITTCFNTAVQEATISHGPISRMEVLQETNSHWAHGKSQACQIRLIPHPEESEIIKMCVELGLNSVYERTQRANDTWPTHIKNCWCI